MDVSEALRRANERIDELNDCFDLRGDPDSRHDYFCECAELRCLRRVALTRSEYRAVRAHPPRFFVASGHVDADACRVVEDLGSFVVVERLAGERSTGEPAAARGTRSTRAVPR